MTQQPDNEQMADTQRKRGRGPTKSYPTVTFEEAAQLPRGIEEHGVGGEINRLTLLSKLNISPSSSKTRTLITDSAKYGLTVGSYNAATLTITEDASTMLNPDTPLQVVREREFDHSIGRFGPFLAVYDRQKESRLRDEAVLRDEFQRAGLPASDCQKAAEVFIANLRYLGLIENIAGSDQVRSIKAVIDKIQPQKANGSAESETSPTGTTSSAPSPQVAGGVAATTSEPTIHIDIQVHIDSSASPEQIDQVFASMAQHLYRRER